MKSPSRLFLPFLTLLALAAVCFFPRMAQAQSWVASNGNWDVPANWSNNAVPTNTPATIDNSGTANLPASVSGTANLVIVGFSGHGTLLINGGALSVGSARIAEVAGSSGLFTISSGTFTDTFTFDVGGSGTATLNINGGTVSDVHVSIDATNNAGASAVANVSSGTWGISSDLNVGSSGTGTLNQTGGTITASTLTLGLNSSSSGTVNISGGTFSTTSSLSSGFRVGTSGRGTLNITGSGVVNVGNSSGTMSLGGGANGGTLNLGGGTLNAGAVNGGSGAVVNFTGSGTTTLAAKIIGSTIVNQSGAGTSVLTAGNTYTGTTTVSAGTLTVNGAISSSPAVVSGGLLNGSGTTGAVTVNNGGTLGGALSSQAVTVNTGGTVSPGNGGTPAADTMLSAVISGSATYKGEIAAPTTGGWAGAHPAAGTDYSQTALTGAGTALTLNPGAILELSVTGTLPPAGIATGQHPYDPAGTNSTLDNYFILALGNSSASISGKFAQATLDGISFTNIDYSAGNLEQNAGVGTFTLGGQQWAISYTGDSTGNSTTGGNDVALTAIPEPGSYALLSLGGAGLVLSVRRRRRA